MRGKLRELSEVRKVQRVWRLDWFSRKKWKRWSRQSNWKLGSRHRNTSSLQQRWISNIYHKHKYIQPSIWRWIPDIYQSFYWFLKLPTVCFPRKLLSKFISSHSLLFPLFFSASPLLYHLVGWQMGPLPRDNLSHLCCKNSRHHSSFSSALQVTFSKAVTFSAFSST